MQRLNILKYVGRGGLRLGAFDRGTAMVEKKYYTKVPVLVPVRLPELLNRKSSF